MDPIAFQLGPFTIRWYGVFAALGFLAGFALLHYRGKHRPIGGDRAADLAFLAIIGGLLGARILYVLQNWSFYSSRPLEIVRIDHGGLIFYGGFFGAALLVAVGSRLKGCELRDVADLFAPVLPLGHAFGRVGCFLNGCCFGRPWRGPGSVRYPAGSDVMAVQEELGVIEPAALACEPVFPVQLVAAAGNALICLLLLRMEGRLRHKGQLFALYVIGYAAFRFGTEFLRGDYLDRTWGLTFAQLFCIVLLPAGLIAFYLLARYDAARQQAGS